MISKDPLDLSRDAAVDASIARAEEQCAKDFQLYHEGQRNGYIAGLREAMKIVSAGKIDFAPRKIEEIAGQLERESIAETPQLPMFGKRCYEAYIDQFGSSNCWVDLSAIGQKRWIMIAKAVIEEARRVGWFP